MCDKWMSHGCQNKVVAWSISSCRDISTEKITEITNYLREMTLYF